MSSSAEESSECGPTFITPSSGKNARNRDQSSHYDLPLITLHMVSLSDSSDGESHKAGRLGCSEKGKHGQRSLNRGIHNSVDKFTNENCDDDSDFDDYTCRVWRTKKNENGKQPLSSTEDGPETKIKKKEKVNEECSHFQVIKRRIHDRNIRIAKLEKESKATQELIYTLCSDNDIDIALLANSSVKTTETKIARPSPISTTYSSDAVHISSPTFCNNTMKNGEKDGTSIETTKAQHGRKRRLIDASKFRRIVWITTLNKKNTRMYNQNQLRTRLTKQIWNVAHYIFCDDKETFSEILARHGDTVLTREFCRSFMKENNLHSSVVDLYMSYCNYENTELCATFKYRTKFYFDCHFTSNLWNMSTQSTPHEILGRLKACFEDPNGPTKVNGMFFLPHCIDQHWFLHVIDTVSKNIIYYDSDISRANTWQRRDFTERIIRFLGYAFKFYCPSIDLATFTFKYGKCSQQKFGHDCGPMMLIFIQKLHKETFGRDGVLSVDAKQLDFHRIELPCQLIMSYNNELVEIVKEEVHQSLERV